MEECLDAVEGVVLLESLARDVNFRVEDVTLVEPEDDSLSVLMQT